jgi:histidinol-phosphate aminotransferase
MSEYQRPSAGSEDARLHLNENNAGCSPRVIEALRALDRADAGRYPDYNAAYESVARLFGVPADHIVLTNGLDEGILASTAVALRDRRVAAPEAIAPSPSFDMYEICTKALGGRFMPVPLGPDFEVRLDAIAERIGPMTRIVFLTNPHNPSGGLTPLEDIRRFASRIAPVILFVDEAYADFSGVTLIHGSALDASPNLVVGRTFSKAYGLAGLRAGAVVAAPQTIAALREVVPPYALNAWATAALPVAIADREYRDWYLAESAESRRLLADACKRLRLETWPSAANFVLIRLGPRVRQVVRELQARHIVVRDRSDEAGCEGCIRATAGLVDETQRLIAALEELVCAEA